MSKGKGKKGKAVKHAMKPKDESELELEDMLFGDVSSAVPTASPVVQKRSHPVVDSDDEEIDYEAEDPESEEEDQNQVVNLRSEPFPSL